MLRRQEQHAVPAAVGSAGNVHREHCAVPGPSGVLVCSGLEQALCAEIHGCPTALSWRLQLSSDSSSSSSPSGRGQGAHHQLRAVLALSLGIHRESERRGGEGEATVVMVLWEGLCWVESRDIWVCPLGFA